MGNMKTPGVYILEQNAFPNSVVEVATAVPAFIGYTEQAINKGVDLTNKPWRITSMAEFHQYFGYGPTEKYTRFKLELLKAAPAAPAAAPADLMPLAGRDTTALSVAGDKYLLTQAAGFYLLYHSMLHFFQSGGGPCYVVSVGSYAADPGINIDRSKFEAALTELTKELEPTMIVMPEAVLMKSKDCFSLQQAAIMHCGTVMKNRVAILDVWEGYQDRNTLPDCVGAFRDGVGTSTLAFASAYYPWVNTTIVQERDLSYVNIDATAGLPLLVDTIKAEAARSVLSDKASVYGPSAKAQPADIPKEDKAMVDRYNAIAAEVDKLTTESDPVKMVLLAKTLATVSPFYNTIITEMAKRLNVLPPSPAMAGVYTMVDNARGVWKAPANVSLNSVVSPTVPISSEQQEDLNVTPQGKSINAIRAFRGEGTLVWGGRTLDGNSLDWRYVNVRRTMIMLEESIRLAAKAMVFEPNVANTWVTMKSMISNFLNGIWKRGGLAGAVPEDAFSVHVGLGETMTSEDILEGILRVTVLVAISRPAEFIEITFQQQMQKS